MRRRIARTMTLGLPAGHAHVAGDGRALVATINDEVVAFGFTPDRLVDCRKEQIIDLGGAQRFAQIGGVFLAETHIERAGAGHPYAIAGFAEIMGERRNKTEPAAGFRNAHIARRSAGPIIDVVEPIALGEPRTNERQRQILIKPAFADFAERHHFDQRQIHAAAVAHSSRRGNSSSLMFLSATALILILRPADCAASIPASTLSSEPQRVIARNFSASSVSSETLIRRMPAARRSRAYFSSCEPLVVSVNSSS